MCRICAFELDPGGVAHETARPVGPDQILGLDEIRRVRRANPRDDDAALIGYRDDLVFAANVSSRRPRGGLQQDLGVLLGAEQRERVRRVEHPEVHTLIQIGEMTARDLDTCVDRFLCDAALTEHLKRPRMDRERLRMRRRTTQLLEHYDVDIAPRQLSRRPQADGSGSDDRNVNHATTSSYLFTEQETGTQVRRGSQSFRPARSGSAIRDAKRRRT